jgi:hypothetical protein
MSKQQIQIKPRPRPQPEEQGDPPTTNDKIARTWFREEG